MDVQLPLRPGCSRAFGSLLPLQPAEIRRRDIELGPVKGEGSTAIVHHGVMVDKVTRKPKEVAIKVRDHQCSSLKRLWYGIA